MYQELKERSTKEMRCQSDSELTKTSSFRVRVKLVKLQVEIIIIMMIDLHDQLAQRRTPENSLCAPSLKHASEVTPKIFFRRLGNIQVQGN